MVKAEGKGVREDEAMEDGLEIDRIDSLEKALERTLAIFAKVFPDDLVRRGTILSVELRVTYLSCGYIWANQEIKR